MGVIVNFPAQTLSKRRPRRPHRAPPHVPPAAPHERSDLWTAAVTAVLVYAWLKAVTAAFLLAGGATVAAACALTLTDLYLALGALLLAKWALRP